jgi:hypothetical protein
MSNKRNRLRDSFAVRTTTITKAANGDLTENLASQSTFRCYVLHKESVLIGGNYGVPQLEFDYVLEVRRETLKAAMLDKNSKVTTSKTGSLVLQVTASLEDTLRKGRIFLKATDT